MLMQKSNDQGSEDLPPQAESVTKSHSGETVISFSSQSRSDVTKRHSKSFRSSRLAAGSSHLAN